MELIEDEIYQEYVEILLHKIANGYHATEEECKYLLACLLNDTEEGMKTEKESFV